MSLQFLLDDLARPLVSLSCQSSDEDMEIDSVSVTDGPDSHDYDDDIQVLACYRESTPFPPQLAARRAMMAELTHCLNGLSLPNEDLIDSISTFTEPPQELLDWCVGGPPSNSYNCYGNDHPITQCSQINPVRDSPWSPPLEKQSLTSDFVNQPYRNDNADSWYGNAYITGLGISVSGICGQQNETFHSGCVVCGKSFEDIKAEITLGYLEQTHVAGETYEQRTARRDAFQAGMKAGSFILVPRGVSQAAACDGVYYQITPENDQNNPGPGVLPI